MIRSILNQETLTRFEHRTSFNITAQEFTTLDHKREIQYMFHKYLFPDFNPQMHCIRGCVANPEKLVHLLRNRIKYLKDLHPDTFQYLHYYNVKGIGPGEATLFFLLDEATLGGGGSGGTDLILGDWSGEIKASHINKEGSATQFRIGGVVKLSDLATQMIDMKSSLKLDTKGSGQAEVSSNQIKVLRDHYPEKMNQISIEYADRVANYFHNDLVIVNNNKGAKGKLIKKEGGQIVAIKRPNPQDITIQCVTQNTIKPIIKI